ncbi:MAG: ParB/RepB/Spo0J family partition protein [Clostridia bacterium]|nr:ParB/RepB/Spo0J family partition protein [Clostridia bacterium]
MKRVKRKKTMNVDYEKKTVRISAIDTATNAEDWDKKDIRTRAAYFLLNGVPEFSVNCTEDGRYALLAAEKDFHAAKSMGVTDLEVRVYSFSDKNAETFSIIERLKEGSLGAMEEAYLMKQLVQDYRFTQDDVAALIGCSRPAVANTLRLLTLAPEVVGLVESGRLSAGHARTLVRVPQSQQYAFAEEAIKRGYSVREMERAVKAFLTPPEVLQQEKDALAAAKSAELKAFVERMRGVFRTKVSLIGNDKKGRIYIDYYTPEDLYRFEEFLDMIESFDRD